MATICFGVPWSLTLGLVKIDSAAPSCGSGLQANSAEEDLCEACSCMARFVEWAGRSFIEGRCRLDQIEGRWIWHAVVSALFFLFFVVTGAYMSRDAGPAEGAVEKQEREHASHTKDTAVCKFGIFLAQSIPLSWFSVLIDRPETLIGSTSAVGKLDSTSRPFQDVAMRLHVVHRSVPLALFRSRRCSTSRRDCR